MHLNECVHYMKTTYQCSLCTHHPDTQLVHFKWWRRGILGTGHYLRGRGYKTGGGGGQMKFFAYEKGGIKHFGYTIFPICSLPPPPRN